MKKDRRQGQDEETLRGRYRSLQKENKNLRSYITRLEKRVQILEHQKTDEDDDVPVKEDVPLKLQCPHCKGYKVEQKTFPWRGGGLTLNICKDCGNREKVK